MEGGSTTEATTVTEGGSGEGVGPLENPAVTQKPNDPLLEPHPSEPGVKGDGGLAAPLENPGRGRS